MIVAAWRAGFAEVVRAFNNPAAHDSLRTRFARGAVWSLAGTVVSNVLAFAASVVTARLLGREGFGELGIINSTVGMLGVLAGLGLGITTTKHVAEFRVSDPRRAGRMIGLTSSVAAVSGLAIALLIGLFAPNLASTMLKAPHLSLELRISCGLLLINAANGVQNAALAGLEAFRTIAQTTLYRGLLAFPIVTAGVLAGGLTGAVWATVAAGAGAWLLTQAALRRECRAAGIRIHCSGILAEKRILWQFSLPAMLGSAMVGPVSWIANTMLVSVPGGYAQMGIFSAANQWRATLLLIPGIIGQVTVPMLSSLLVSGTAARTRKLLAASVVICAACTLPVVLALALFSHEIMSLYGGGFGGHGTVLIFTAATAGLIALQTPVANVIASSGRMWVGLAMNVGWALSLLGFTWFFLGRGWGAEGAAAAYTAAYLTHSIWVTCFALRILRAQKKHEACASDEVVPSYCAGAAR